MTASAWANGATSVCSHEVCAERRLLASVVRSIREEKKTVRIVDIRRAVGGVTVSRMRSDGSYGVSAPCLACRLALKPLDVRVAFCDTDGEWCVMRSGDFRMEGSMVTRADKKRWGWV